MSHWYTHHGRISNASAVWKFPKGTDHIIVFLWHLRKGKTVGICSREQICYQVLEIGGGCHYRGAAQGNVGGVKEPYFHCSSR